METWLIYMAESGDRDTDGCWPQHTALPEQLCVEQPDESQTTPGWFGACPFVVPVDDRDGWHVRYRSTDIPAMLQWLYEHDLCSESERDRWLLDYTLYLTSGT